MERKESCKVAVSLRSQSVQMVFVVLVVVIFLILDTALALFVINWSRLVSVLMFVFLTFFNFSFSLLLAKRILSFLVKPYHLPKLQNLTDNQELPFFIQP
jgi:hypothetical protein